MGNLIETCCGAETRSSSSNQHRFKGEPFTFTMNKNKQNNPHDPSELDIIDIVTSIIISAYDSSTTPNPAEFLDVIKLMTSDFALYQLTTGHLRSQQDTDYVPGKAVVELLKKYFVPHVFPIDFPFERFVGKLCWFAGRQRSISNFQAAIHAVVDDEAQDGEDDDENDPTGVEIISPGTIGTSGTTGITEDTGDTGESRDTGEIEQTGLGQQTPGSAKFESSQSQSQSESNNATVPTPSIKPIIEVKNGNLLFVESIPIKRLLSALVLMSDCHIERKLRCLELLDRPNYAYPNTFESCPAKDKCIYLIQNGTSNRGVYSEIHKPNRGQCTCSGISTLQAMENIFCKTWSICYRIHLALSADDSPWINDMEKHVQQTNETISEFEEDNWHPIMCIHSWTLTNGISIKRSDLIDIVETSSEWQRLIKLFHIVPHLYEESDVITTVCSAKEKLKRGLNGNFKSRSNNNEASNVSTLEARLGFRQPNWSMYQNSRNGPTRNGSSGTSSGSSSGRSSQTASGRSTPKNESSTDVDDMLIDPFSLTAITMPRSDDVISEWKCLLLHGLDTIQSETINTYPSHVVLRASKNWLDALDFSVEYSHVALEVAASILTSPLTTEDLEHASMTSNVNNVGNGCRERNPWDAIRQDDVTSLTYLLQHGAVDETSYDPDTGKEF